MAPLVTHLAPVLIVDDVKLCIDFWVDRFGFTKENEVPGPDGTLVFASVKSEARVEIMYQSTASVLAEDPKSGADLKGHSVALFLQVSDLDTAEAAAKGAPVVKARHKTFYGSTEFYIKEPGGNTVGFASFG